MSENIENIDDWCRRHIAHAEGCIDASIPDLPPENIQLIPSNQCGAAAIVGGVSFYKVLNENTNLSSTAKVLDFGCGWGRMSRLALRTLTEENISGVDVESKTIEAAKKAMPRGTFKCISPGDELPFADSAFDIVFANSVFSHLSEPAHLFYMSEIHRCLKSGGVLLSSFLDGGHMERWFARDPAWISALIGTEDEAERKFSKSGFVYGHSHRIQDYGITFVSTDWFKANSPLKVKGFPQGYVQSLLKAEK